MKMPFVISRRGKLERKKEIILKSRQVGATTMFMETGYVYAPYVPLIVTKSLLAAK